MKIVANAVQHAANHIFRRGVTEQRSFRVGRHDSSSHPSGYSTTIYGTEVWYPVFSSSQTPCVMCSSVFSHLFVKQQNVS